jgi:hypothetical protein
MKSCPDSCSPRVVVRPDGVHCFGGLVFVLALFFTPVKGSAALYDLTLNPQDLQKVGSYTFYTWSQNVSWEVSQSAMAGEVNYNKVCTFDATSNTIGMHLLDVEKNNSYAYNLGIVLTAGFNSNENGQSRKASGWIGDSGRERPGDVGCEKKFGLGITPSDSPHKLERSCDNTTTPTTQVPEPGAVLYLLPAFLILAWRRVWPGLNW